MKLLCTYNRQLKAKDVPLHPWKALGGRGVIAPTLSLPRHCMGVSSQRHAPTALFTPGERFPGTHWTRGCVDRRASVDTEVRRK